MYVRNKKNTDRNTPRQADEIVEQLALLLQIKKTAIESAQGNFADEVNVTTIECEERALYAELRAALRPAARRPRSKRAG